VPWQEVSTMSLRKEFVMLARQPDANISELCRRFEISRKTAYKYLSRYAAKGTAGLADQSRRPQQSPRRTSMPIEQVIVGLREQHPAWGARKLLKRLEHLGYMNLPAPSTAHAILQRRGLISTEQSMKHCAYRRFEREHPNSLWQMDFKGHFPLADYTACHPLTVLDDHSRFNLGLRACSNEQGVTVRDELTALFRRYGLPEQIGVDNGAPWGYNDEQPYTGLVVWMIRVGITVWHSRPYHPQTLGKDERFHRTLKAELLTHRSFRDLRAAQCAFDHWREIYNCERPHDALDGHTPAARYRPSPRPFPEAPPPVEYASDRTVRKVDESGKVSLRGRSVRIGKAFRGYHVGLSETCDDGIWDVYFCHQRIQSIDLRAAACVTSNL
jgi:transposase InsO family protein